MSSDYAPTAPGWIAETVRFGRVHFFSEYPLRVLVTVVLPRPVLQYLFFVTLGGVLAGPAYREFALVGAPTVTLMQVAVLVGDVPLTDKWSGTFNQVRSGRPSPFLVMVLRALPYPLLGTVALAICLLVVPPLTGHARLAGHLVEQLPLYTVMAFSTCAAGLAVALLSMGKRADVLLCNLLAYLILLAGGVFIPPERVPFAEVLGVFLPVGHGLVAVRAALDGRPWLAPALAEVLVGLGWLLVGYLTLRIQIWRANRYGHDDFN